MSKPRKRIYLINRDFQLRYSFAASIVGVLTTVLTSTVVIVPLFSFEILKTTKFLPTPILFGMVFACIMNIGIILALGIFVTHRIAGPMYSLVRSFRTMCDGNYLAQVRLREDDDLKYVVRNFNEMVDCVVENTNKDIETLEAVLAGGPAESNAQTLKTLLAQMKTRVPQIP